MTQMLAPGDLVLIKIWSPRLDGEGEWTGGSRWVKDIVREISIEFDALKYAHLTLAGYRHPKKINPQTILQKNPHIIVWIKTDEGQSSILGKDCLTINSTEENGQ